jgi:tRNA (guanine26-N2/guanine27-N2)-dimethyltransferase
MATEKATLMASIEIPPGFKLHTENTSHILLPDNNEAFLNPVQEFNRDLSVACIRTWAAEREKLQERKWLQRQEQQRAGNGKSQKRRKGSHDLWSP